MAFNWEWLCMYVHTNLVLYFDRLAQFNSACSSRVIGLAVAAVFALATGVVRMEEVTEKRIEKLWCPLDSLALEHQGYVWDRFGPTPVSAQFMLTNVDGSDILSKSRILALYDLEDKVSALGEYPCDKVFETGPCDKVSAVQYWGGSREAMAESFTSGDALGVINRAGVGTLDDFGMPIWPKYILGSVRRNSTTNAILGADALMSNYFVTADAEGLTKEGKAWQRKFVDLMKAQEGQLAGKGIELHFMAFTSMDDELNRGINNATSLAFLSVTAIGFFLFLVMIPQFAPKLDKTSLLRLMKIHAAAMAMILLSLPAGVGLAMLCGVKYTPITIIIIFLVLGIGVDDAVLMMTSWSVTNPSMSISHRNRETLAHSGAAVTLTSVTTVLAFLVGSTSIFPAVQHFCLSAALTLFACYVLCITFFNATLVKAEKSYDDSTSKATAPSRDGCIIVKPYRQNPHEVAREEAINMLHRSNTSKSLLRRATRTMSVTPSPLQGDENAAAPTGANTLGAEKSNVGEAALSESDRSQQANGNEGAIVVGGGAGAEGSGGGGGGGSEKDGEEEEEEEEEEVFAPTVDMVSLGTAYMARTVLHSRPIKLVIVLMFGVAVVLGAWGAMYRLEEGLDVTELVSGLQV
jgi:hypothetical protein